MFVLMVQDASHVFGDSGFADIVTEFEQLTVNAGCCAYHLFRPH